MFSLKTKTTYTKILGTPSCYCTQGMHGYLEWSVQNSFPPSGWHMPVALPTSCTHMFAKLVFQGSFMLSPQVSL